MQKKKKEEKNSCWNYKKSNDELVLLAVKNVFVAQWVSASSGQGFSHVTQSG